MNKNIDTAVIIVNHDNKKSIITLIDSIYRYESLENVKIFLLYQWNINMR